VIPLFKELPDSMTLKKFLLPLLFHVYVLVIIFMSLKDPIPSSPNQYPGLFDGTNEGYPALGMELEPFRKVLPKNATVSLLTDVPLGQEAAVIKEYARVVQGFLCPILVSHEPTQSVAIVLASSDVKAMQRFAETGYEWAFNAGHGKGIAKKK
jgi:hypothetical protein